MSDELTLNETSVIHSLNEITETIKKITVKRDELSYCLEQYKTAFVDDISELTRELVKKIDDELDRMNTAIDAYASKYKEIMGDVTGFREA